MVVEWHRGGAAGAVRARSWELYQEPTHPVFWDSHSAFQRSPADNILRTNERILLGPVLAWGGGRDALEGKGPQRRPQLDRRLEEVAKAVGGGYCPLEMPLSWYLALGGQWQRIGWAP